MSSYLDSSGTNMHSVTTNWRTILSTELSCAPSTWNTCLPILRLILLNLLFVSATPSYSEAIIREQSGVSDTAIQAIKYQAVELISQLHLLEEKLLYPAQARVAVFLSLAENSYIEPRSVSLGIDNNIVANHVYTQSETQALLGGGIQRLYTGNILMGKHKLHVSMKTQNDKQVRKHDIEYKFNKEKNVEYIEIIVSNSKPYVAVTRRD